jgi:hypothetical protein
MAESVHEPALHAHDVLVEHGLPARLLPEALTSSRFDPSSGRLEVELPGPAEAKFDGIPVRYAPRVRALVAHGRISELEGVEARFALWLKVRAIRRDSDSLVFAVGRLGKRLPLAAFEG